MQDGDAVDVELYVSLPGAVRRLYRKGSYSGAADSRLLSLSDVAGAGAIAGNSMDFVLRQTASATGFAPPLRIPFQLVVESQ
jgi:hypothetical protein